MFNVSFVENEVCESCKQCTEPTGQPQNILLNQKKKKTRHRCAEKSTQSKRSLNMIRFT